MAFRTRNTKPETPPAEAPESIPAPELEPSKIEAATTEQTNARPNTNRRSEDESWL